MGFTSKTASCLLAAIGISVLSRTAANGAVIMDQIGLSPTFVTGQGAYASDVFETGFAKFDTAVLDDFTVTGPSSLTKIYAAVDGFGTFVSYSGVTSWDVEIYSSLTAASTSLVGDVYGHVFTPANVNLTTPFGGSSTSALFNVSTAITLPSAGTYYLAVIANNSEATNGEVGVYATTGVANPTPGGLNAYQVNPLGGFGFASNENALSLDAAYAITGVTVPEPVTAMGVVLMGSVMCLSRRRLFVDRTRS